MPPANFIAWLPLLVLVATMPVFAVLARKRAPDPDVARRHASVLLGYWLRDWMVWVLSPLERLLVRMRVPPDALNYAGAALGLLAGAAFIARALPLAAWLVAVGGVADILDGRVARTRGMSSAYGAFLDSTLDRFGETFTFVGVAWYLSASAWAVAATVLAACGSLLVSYTRARGEALGVVCRSGFAQRAERLVLLALAALLDPAASGTFGWRAGTLLSAAVVVIAVGSLATAWYRMIVISRSLARRPADAVSPAAPLQGPENEAAAQR